MVSAVRLESERNMAHFEEQLEQRRHQNVVVHPPNQKVLLTQTPVAAQPVLQTVQDLLVGRVHFHTPEIHPTVVTGSLFAPPTRVQTQQSILGRRIHFALLGDEAEDLDHADQLVAVEHAVLVLVEHLEAELDALGGRAAASRRYAAAQLFEVDVAVSVHVQCDK